ncbi:MAG: sulfatase-like hydrolase/transferase, partial [Planctomycetaceae bacterium]|nr:sulfatase-like hydrolase/transferase [Planctomycetaceae bacterium]
AIYSGTIDNTDRAIHRLLKKLKHSGALENTIIIYTSDHGSFRPDRNGGLRGNKGSLFEGGIRTPGIVYWPKRIKGGRIEDTPAGAVDLLPTICGLVGIEKPKGVHLDGADLSPLLAGRSADFKRHQPLTWHSPTSQPIAVIREGKYSLVGYRNMEYPRDQDTIRAVMDEMRVILEKKLDRKLTRSELWHKAYNSEIKTPEWNRLRGKFVTLNTFQEAWIPLIKKGSGGITRFELYDLSTDPGQKHNIAQRFPETTNRLKEQVLAINAGVLKEAPEWAPYRPIVASATKPKPRPNRDDADLEKLLTRIDKAVLPADYDPAKHQAYVDGRLKSLQPQQRGRIGLLWKQKRRLQPNMQNAGMSFVRILEYVAAGEKPAGKTGIDTQTVNWHQWRGPEANGVSRTAKPPIQWSENKNVRWKAAIKGKGNASPVVWSDRVFLLTAINTGRVDPSRPKPEDQPKRVFGIKHPNTYYRFEVLCLDRNTGKELWRQTASEHVPHEGTHHDADFASSSPTTDGKRLYCWFGSAGMHCYDLNG